ncbi:MAG: FtsX-like permease family protein [Roseivirga sp.]|nr:FtsX-like permease family protein [Roseivirga sp.]
MNYPRNLKLSLKTMTDQKLRTLLAALGVSIGIAAVMSFISVGQGAKEEISKKLENYGTNVLLVSAGKQEANIGQKELTRDVTTLSLKDAQKLGQEVAGIRQIAPHQARGAQVKYDNRITSVTVDGSTPEYFELKNFVLASGRFFTADENKVRARVAVIGDQIKEQLFQGIDPVGERLQIGRIPFEIVGVLKKRGITGNGANEDDRIVIPLQTALRRVFNVNYLQDILVQISSQSLIDQADTDIKEVMRASHRLDRYGKKNDFKVFNQIKAIEAEQEASETFNSLTLSVAALSLVVGGTGILAVMLLSVKERLPEIGLRMALGAGRGDIVFQFLAESTILSLTGTIIGIGMGYLSTYLVERFTDWSPIIPPDIIGYSFLFSLILGLIFGSYPAYQASKQDPVVCLNQRN